MTPELEAHLERLRAWTALTDAEREAWHIARETGRPPSEIDLRLAMDAELCPAGTGPCGCSGGPPRECAHPDRPLHVWRSECIACVTRAWWEAGTG